jgi:hypothetical protein
MDLFTGSSKWIFPLCAYVHYIREKYIHVWVFGVHSVHFAECHITKITGFNDSIPLQYDQFGNQSLYGRFERKDSNDGKRLKTQERKCEREFDPTCSYR